MPDFLFPISRAGWSLNTPGGSAVDRTDVTCPYFPDLPVYESKCTDGQRAGFDPSANRRNDIQRGPTEVGSHYCIDFAFRMLAVPSFRAGDWGWNLVGPEVHGRTLNQAPIQPQVLPSSGTGAQGTPIPRRRADLPAGEPRYFMDADAGRGGHRYWDLGPAPRASSAPDGGWALFRFEFPYTQGSSGYLRVSRGGVLVADIRGATVAESADGWFKVANYSREVYVDGPQNYQIAGRFWECAGPNDLPPMPTLSVEEPDPDPPPPPSDPCAAIRAELSAARIARDEALAALTTVTAERNAAAAMALDLRSRIDAAKPGIRSAADALG